jgi:hypothetical protein
MSPAAGKPACVRHSRHGGIDPLHGPDDARGPSTSSDCRGCGAGNGPSGTSRASPPPRPSRTRSGFGNTPLGTVRMRIRYAGERRSVSSGAPALTGLSRRFLIRRYACPPLFHGRCEYRTSGSPHALNSVRRLGCQHSLSTDRAHLGRITAFENTSEAICLPRTEPIGRRVLLKSALLGYLVRSGECPAWGTGLRFVCSSPAGIHLLPQIGSQLLSRACAQR